MKMFGIDSARAAELRSILDTIVQEVNQHPTTSKVYPNSRHEFRDLARLQGSDLICSTLEPALKRIVESSGGDFVHLPLVSSAADLNIENVRNRYNRTLKWAHLSKPVLILAHLPGHFIFLFVDHNTHTVNICDSLSRTPGSMQLANNVIDWLAESHVKKCKEDKVAVSPAPAYTVAIQRSVPRQADATSCGAFAVASAYFLVHHGRLPTPTDFTGADSTCLRLALLDICIRGAQEPIE
jgi:hypothetical protein